VALDEAELADVARDGRLRDATADARECDLQLMLRPEPHPLDEARDESLPFGLRQVFGLHKNSITYS
jgi:hypothetical protein